MKEIAFDSLLLIAADVSVSKLSISFAQMEYIPSRTVLAHLSIW